MDLLEMSSYVNQLPAECDYNRLWNVLESLGIKNGTYVEDMGPGEITLSIPLERKLTLIFSFDFHGKYNGIKIDQKTINEDI